MGFITKCMGSSVFGISLSDHELERGSFEVKEPGTSFICSLKMLVDRKVVAIDVAVVVIAGVTVVRTDVDLVLVTLSGARVFFGGRGRFFDPFMKSAYCARSFCGSSACKPSILPEKELPKSP